MQVHCVSLPSRHVSCPKAAALNTNLGCEQKGAKSPGNGAIVAGLSAQSDLCPTSCLGRYIHIRICRNVFVSVVLIIIVGY